MTKEVKDILYNMSLMQYKNGIHKILNGHEIFRMNIEDGIIDKPQGTISTEYDKFNKPYKKINIEFKLGYIYIPALNLTNAHKKADKIVKYAAYKAHTFALQAGLENTQINT